MNRLCSLLENCHWRGNIGWADEAAAHQLIGVSLSGRIPLSQCSRCVRTTFLGQGQELDTMVLVGHYDFMILLLEGCKLSLCVAVLRCPMEQSSCRLRLWQ